MRGTAFFWRGLGYLLAAATAFLAWSASAQKGFEAQGFQAADFYGPPHETQMKSFLKGAQARPLDNGLLLVVQAVLETFRETGERELMVQAPECLYDTTNKTANSAGSMHAQTADTKFSIEGEGFLWRQTNSSLYISNNVHTVVQSDLLTSPAERQSSNKPESAAPLDIFSDKFEYTSDTGKAIYRQHAHVSGTNLDLAGSVLTLDLPQSAPGKPAELKSILVETNVVLHYTNYSGTNVTAIRATGQHALYIASTGRVRVTGDPAWTAEGRAGRGDELLLDRTNKIFNANGHAWLKLPGQSFGAGLLTRSNTGSTQGMSASNRVVEVFSDNYELRTNWGVFRQDVRVNERLGDQERGRMTCNWMTVSFAGSNELQQLVARTNVVIEQETNRFTAGTAVYTGTNGVLELTENPTWRSGDRSGKGKVVRVKSDPDEMFVQGNASVRLPAEELGQPLTPGLASVDKPRTRPAVQQFADVFCEDYTLRQDEALFRGGVYASHTNMNWACESLRVQSIPGGTVLTAEQGVVFDLVDERGQKIHGTGNKAIYTNSIIGSVTNDLLTLFGTTAKPAVLTTTNGTFDNPVITLDRVTGKLTALGSEFHIRGTNAVASTNLFLSPTRKPKP
jgi:lipopolysaccharide export system protein LptA